MNQAQLAQPTMFALSKNYRSHQGILALASQVMDWLWKGIRASENRELIKTSRLIS